jgi:hypothetical protein
MSRQICPSNKNFETSAQVAKIRGSFSLKVLAMDLAKK